MRARLIGVSLMILFWTCGPGAAQEKQKLTVAGTLQRAMGIGGESSGWSIQFDSEMIIDGKPMHSIEVTGPNEKFEGLSNKTVKAKGKLTHRHGVERGDWPVLDVSSIKRVKTKKTS